MICAFEYDPPTDEFVWRQYSRESLIDSIVREAIAQRYGAKIAEGGKVGMAVPDGSRVALRSTWRNTRMILANLLRGIVRDGLSANEATEIRDAWRRWWRQARVAAA